MTRKLVLLSGHTKSTIQTTPVLYKRTTTGKTQTWLLAIEGDHYRSVSGQQGGKQVTSAWTVAKVKNAGRSNATTPEEQALVEAWAAYDKKLRDGYSETPDAAQGSERFQCMLADSYVDNNDPKKSRKPRVLAALASGAMVYSQPKLDGIRLISSADSLLSRKGRPIIAVPHIAEALAPIFEACPDLILDGELYAHSYRDDFDSLVSIVRKGKPSKEDLEAAQVMEYWVYDCAGPEWESHGYYARWAFLAELLRDLSIHLHLVPTEPVANENEIDAAYQGCLKQGYEGQMLRLDVPYERRRSDKLVKRKEFEDKEFEVLEVVEGEGNRSGQAGFVRVLERETGTKFKSGIRAPLVKRLWLLKNADALVGADVTIRFNGRTPQGVPRFPRAIAWYQNGRDV